MKRKIDVLGRRVDVWTPTRPVKFGTHRHGKGTPSGYRLLSLRWLMLRIWSPTEGPE